MKNNIESFIHQNRAAFDAETPTTQVWANVARALASTDALEQFIAQNRSLFDREMPAENMLAAVTRSLESSSSLEKIIFSNRAALDKETPTGRVWAGVERALDSADHLEKYIWANRPSFDTCVPAENIWATIETRLSNKNNGLEAFLTENRANFDAETPDLKVWANIDQALPAPKQPAKTIHISWQRHLMRAAAAITLVLTCFGAGMWYANSNLLKGEMAMGDVSHEYQELEGYYQRDIAGKEQALAQFTANNETVQEDLAQLDRTMEELRKELADVPPSSREKVIKAMIDTYKTKAAILEKVLGQIQDNQQHLPLEKSKSSDRHDIKNI